MQGNSMRALAVLGGIVLAGSLAGCASHSTGSKFADTGATDCAGLQKQIARMAGGGIQGKIEAVQAGRKVSGQARSQIDEYNSLLEQYLGSHCQNR